MSSSTIAWGDLQQIYYGTVLPPNAPVGSIFIHTINKTIQILDYSGWITLTSGGGGTPHPLLDGSQNNDTEPITPSMGMLIYSNSFNLWDALNPGTNGYVLTMVAGQPAWQPASGGGGTGSWSRIFVG